MADVRVYSDEESDSKSSAHFGALGSLEDEKERKSRAFVACANCRKAKAKCDLGDVNHPKDPPCARCRRRTITCEFLPSKRSGRMSYEARQALKAEDGTSKQTGEGSTSLLPLPSRPKYASKASEVSYQAPMDHSSMAGPSNPPATFSTAQQRQPTSGSAQPPQLQSQLSTHQLTSLTNTHTDFTSNSWPEEWQRFAEARGLFEHQASDPSPGGISQTSQEMSKATPPSFPTPKPTQKSQESGAPKPHKDGKEHPRPQKRKFKEKEEDRAEELAAANLRNPVDAMSLLVMAAGERKGPNANKGKQHRSNNRESTLAQLIGIGKPGDGDETGSSGSRADDDGNDAPGSTPYELSDFPLVKRGVLNTIEVFYYVNLFFTKLHPIFPLVPHHRIPRTEAQLTAFAKAELHLTTVFILIASRLDQGTGNQGRIHEQTWIYMQELITRLVFGEEVSVGAVEALLLLSENPPRALASAGNHREDFAEENRMSWNIVGLAVRLGYMLSLDQISFYPIKNKGKENAEPLEKTERERVAWTYCYLFDRQIAIRTGKAFWSRGPGLMFSGSSADYFPSMRPVPGVQDDFASLLQAYADITQILQNAHDVLYPSKDRSIALVSMGEYHKYLDEFTRALNNYRAIWETKKWSTFPLTECVWVTFHYVRLYVYAFAFQASIQRGVQQNNGSSVEAVRTGIFKRGTMSSPDARFLMESVEAACDMLRICTERLHPSNVLQYLPWRFFLYFSYAGVFLLKAIFLNAVASSERRSTVRLLRRLIVCLAGTSSDPHHHAVRYARLLDSLLRTFSRGQDGVDTSSPQDQLLQTSISKPEGAAVKLTTNMGGSDSPWPVSRPVSPNFGHTNPAHAASANPPPSTSIPMSFWGGTSVPHSTGQTPATTYQAITGDYRNYNDTPMSSFGQSFSGDGTQQGQPSSNTAFGSGGSMNYMQLANQNLGGQPAFSPHSDSMVLPMEAYTNLLDDTTLDFWTALTNSQDWGPPAETNVGGEFFPGF